MKTLPLEAVTALGALAEAVHRLDIVVREFPVSDTTADDRFRDKLFKSAGGDAVRVGYNALETLGNFGIKTELVHIEKAFEQLKAGPMKPSREVA